MVRCIILFGVGALCFVSLALADVACSRCKTVEDYSGCQNLTCQNVQGRCLIDTLPDPEDPESTINVFVDTHSYELIHLTNPKFCGPQNSAIGPDGADCVGTKEYICYKKVSYASTGCGGGACEEFGTVIGCSVTMMHHNCLVIP